MSIFSRQLGYDEELGALGKPALISHGRKDAVVSPTAAEEHAALVPRARLSL